MSVCLYVCVCISLDAYNALCMCVHCVLIVVVAVEPVYKGHLLTGLNRLVATFDRWISAYTFYLDREVAFLYRRPLRQVPLCAIK